MRRVWVAASFVLMTVPLPAQQRLPIIDMHLHALAADEQGPPPLAMCTPIGTSPAWDPLAPFGEVFLQRFKDPPCDDPVWSPTTDEEVMVRTLDVLERLNVIGVLSRTAERVAAWRTEAPERLIPGLIFNLAARDVPGPEELRRRITRGDVRVLGGVTNQYAGIAPDDKRMEPYWALAEARHPGGHPCRDRASGSDLSGSAWLSRSTAQRADHGGGARTASAPARIPDARGVPPAG
jgi:uncharacterized protein